MPDHIVVEIEGEPCPLRVTLGAAIDVHASLGGFDGAFQRLRALDIDAVAIVTAAGRGGTPGTMRPVVFATGLEVVVPRLLEFVLLLSQGGREPGEEAADGELVTHEQYHDSLLKLGMGWLGWSEQQTRDTTMRGILLAHQGRVDMLQAIFGGGKPPKGGAPKTPATPTRLRDALRMLGGGRKRRRGATAEKEHT